MARYRKIYVEDTAVLLVGQQGIVHLFGMRVSGIPIGLWYRPAGPVWCLLDFIPWDDVPAELRADKDTIPYHGDPVP